MKFSHLHVHTQFSLLADRALKQFEVSPFIFLNLTYEYNYS